MYSYGMLRPCIHRSKYSQSAQFQTHTPSFPRKRESTGGATESAVDDASFIPPPGQREVPLPRRQGKFVLIVGVESRGSSTR